MADFNAVFTLGPTCCWIKSCQPHQQWAKPTPNWYSYKPQHQPNLNTYLLYIKYTINTSTWRTWKEDEREPKQWDVDDICLRGDSSRWGCWSVGFLPTLPPPGDITWVGELPCTGPSFCVCHISLVDLLIGDSHKSELFLVFLRRCASV